MEKEEAQNKSAKLSQNEREYLCAVLPIIGRNNDSVYMRDQIEEKFVDVVGGEVMRSIREWIITFGREPDEADTQFWTRVELAREKDIFRKNKEIRALEKRKRISDNR